MKNYDPTQVAVNVAGAVMHGFADGEFVTFEEDSDAFSDAVGTDGEVTRSKSSDARGTLTIKLMQSSDSNDILSAVFELDRSSPNGAGVFAASVEDLNGRSLHSGAECWVSKAPAVSYDRTPKPREWKIRIANTKRIDGGNL